MDKRITVGIVAGIVFGLIETFLFVGAFNLMYLIIVAVLGGLIGFVSTQKLPINFYLMSAIIGAIFYVPIAVHLQADYLDQVVTGAVTGLVIAFLINLIDEQMTKA
ncbi:MAG: hypothetical protein ACPGVB_04665 [Chitinophagales bacterium]